MLNFQLVGEIEDDSPQLWNVGSDKRTGVRQSVQSLGWYDSESGAALDLVTLTTLTGTPYSNPWLIQVFAGPFYAEVPGLALYATYGYGTEPGFGYDDTPPDWMFPADLDHDGDMDVVLKNGGPYGEATEVCIQEAGPSYSCGNVMWMLGSMETAVADMNDDQYLDIITAGPGYFQIWFNSGDGTFASDVLWADVPLTYSYHVAAEPQTQQVAVADLTGLALFDLTWSELEGPILDFRYEIKGLRVSGELAWTDADGDADPDLLGFAPTLDEPSTIAFTLFTAVEDGDGYDLVPSWRDQEPIVDDPPCSAIGWGALALGDFDLDGDEDFVSDSTTSSTMLFYLNDGTGQYTLDLQLPDRSGPLAVADRDGDGDLDLAMRDCTDGNVLVYDNQVIPSP